MRPKSKIIHLHFITMNFKRFLTAVVLTLLSVASFYTVADNVSADKARAMANSFIKSHYKAAPGSLQAPSMSDIVLTHAEPSNKIANSNVYYIFNIKGGGFIIVSGDDQAAPVLGYSDKGQIDVNNMAEPLKDIFDGYKSEIEYLQTHDIKNVQSSRNRIKASNNGVEPLLKTTWGSEEPYNYQCPMLDGKYSKVGCVGVCMAQMICFWEYPVDFMALPGYYSSYLGDNVPDLPETTMDYSKMISSYAHWDFGSKSVVFETFTEEQVQEAAKLCRYCGQSVKMNYSPSLSMTTNSKLTAMKNLGYSSRAYNIYRTAYGDEEWENLLQGDLNAGRPVLYAAYGASSVGHAFIVDGYNSEHYYHMNMGWYGYDDGWYLLSAIIFINRFGEERNYYTKHSMILGMVPPMFCTVNTEIEANNGLLRLGEVFNPQAVDVRLSMSYQTLPFMFSLTDADGNLMAISESVTLNRLTFEQGSDISLALMLPETLPEGTYNLNLNYRTGNSEPLTPVVTAAGQLMVVGKLAKFGAPFGISDVADAIDLILSDTSSEINIADVSSLIDYLLER